MTRSAALASRLLRAALLGTTALVLLGAPPAFARVGVTSATDGDPLGKPPQENERILRIGIDVQANEVVTTHANDRAHLVFLDGTSLTVGPNARLTIDKFVYDPNTKTGDLAITATQGVFRLVGGKISKARPVTITTPSSTIGIRGGITLVNVQPNETTSTFVFGNNMTVTGQGQTQNVTRPGSQVTTNSGQAPGAPTLAPQGSLGGQMAQLEGRGSGQGGSGSGGQGGAGGGQGGNADQGARGFGQHNSGQGQALLRPPGIHQGGPIGVNNPLNNRPPVSDTNHQQQTNNATNPSNNTDKTTTSTSTTVVVTKGRYLADPVYSNFNSADLSVTPSATKNKALSDSGSVKTTTTTTTRSNSSTTTTSTSLTITVPGTGDISLPWKQDTLTNGFSIDDRTDATFGQLQNGKGYVSSDGKFFAYIFDTTNNKKVGFFGGDPVQLANFPTSGVAKLKVGNLGSASRLPFANDTIGDNTALNNSKSVSDLYIAYSSTLAAVPGQATPNDNRSTAMQATVSINGSGSSQKSYMGVFIGTFFRDLNGTSNPTDKGVALGGNFQSTYRTDASDRIGRQISYQSSADTGNNNAIYGAGGGSLAMVLVPDKLAQTFTTSGGNVQSVTTTRTSGAAFDQPYTNLSGSDYFTGTAAYSPTTVSTTRTANTFNGYLGGLVEKVDSSSTFTTRIVATSDPNNVSIQTSPTSNRATATMTVQWDTGTSAAFQMGGLTGASGSSSAFIDDNTYAIRDRSSDIGGTTTVGGSSTGVTSNTTMVSYNAAPVASFFSGQGVTPCTCAFLTWGWWSGDVAYANNSTYNPGGRDRANMATFVAGKLADPNTQLPTNIGNATYTGHLLGNVNNNGNSYMAAGTYQNVWSFATRNGIATVTFDGATFGGGTSPNTFNTAGTATFSTSTAITSGNKSLTLNGAFFGTGTPPQGQAGSFSITNTTGNPYKAAGTFAAQK